MIPLIITSFIWYILVSCCDELILTSSGATHTHQSNVLGTYRKNGASNGWVSYKNDNDRDRHLHFSTNTYWMVRIAYGT